MTDDELEKLFASLREESAAAHAETRRHFDVVAERLETKIEAVAERVASVDEKLDRETTEIRDEMRLGFADTQAMIKFHMRSSTAASVPSSRLESTTQ